MKSVRADLDSNIKQLKIIPIADLHIGSPECNQTLVHEYIERLKNEEHTYCILGGDLIDNSIIGSVGDVYEQSLTPMGQLGLSRNITSQTLLGYKKPSKLFIEAIVNDKETHQYLARYYGMLVRKEKTLKPMKEVLRERHKKADTESVFY